MKSISLSILGLSLLLALSSCKKSAEPLTPLEPAIEQSAKDSLDTTAVYESQSANDELAAKVSQYLANSYLQANDLAVIKAAERTFKLSEVDLNQDGKNEVFVYLNTPYFCGSGGCTFLLLSADLKPITQFTTTRPPFYVEPMEKNGWKVLSVQSQGEWKELSFDRGTYPSNPSVAKTATYKAPSAEAQLIFSPEEQQKTYTF